MSAQTADVVIIVGIVLAGVIGGYLISHAIEHVLDVQKGKRDG